MSVYVHAYETWFIAERNVGYLRGRNWEHLDLKEIRKRENLKIAF
jgi:hypothetical protein